MVRRKLIRSLVERLLTEHRVRSVPIPVETIAKAVGVRIQKEPTDEDLSGFLYRDRQRKTVIIGVNASQHSNRQNFTMAHELGHFLLHDFDDVHVDRQFKVWLRNEASSQGLDLEEKEANLFAAELLMPARFLASEMDKICTVDLEDETVLKTLAEKYGVSTQAMTFRLAYLGYLQQ